MQILVGTNIDGRFEIIDRLGVGGTGSVFLAKQSGFDRHVAIKLVDPMSELSDDAIARFEREAQALSQLKHRYIISVYSFGMWSGRPYIAMEYVPGKSLQEVIADGCVEPAAAFQIVSRVCEALDCAHAYEIVHRDVKPSNIVIDAEGTPRLIDFGFAKLFARSAQQQQLTEAGCAVGTVSYMAPEQCLGQPCDGRSDIYAAGCVLFHCLTGEPPFLGDHSLVVMNKHIQDPIPLLSERTGGKTIPEGAQEIIDKSMAKDPVKRYQTAGAMKQDIDLLLAGEPVEASGIIRSAVSSLPKPVTWQNKAIRIAAGILALLMLSVAGYLWVDSRRSVDAVVATETQLLSLNKQLKEAEKGRSESSLSEVNERLGKAYTRLADLETNVSKQNEYKLMAIQRYQASAEHASDTRNSAAILEKCVSLATFDVRLRQEVLRKSLAFYLVEAEKSLEQRKTADVEKLTDKALYLTDIARSELSVYGARAHAFDLKARAARMAGNDRTAMHWYKEEDSVFRKHAPESTHHVLAQVSMAMCAASVDPQGSRDLRKKLVSDCLSERRMNDEGRERIAAASLQLAQCLSDLQEDRASVIALVKRSDDLNALIESPPSVFALGRTILGGINLREGKVKAAMKDYSAALDAYGDDAKAALQSASVAQILSELYRISGDADRALYYDLKARKIAAAAKLAPSVLEEVRANAVIRLSVYSSQKRPELLPRVYERASMLSPDGVGRTRAMSLAGGYFAFNLIRDGNTHRAKQIADELEMLGEKRVVHHIRAASAAVDGNFDKSVAEWEMAINYATKDSTTEEQIASMRAAQKRIQGLLRPVGSHKK